MALTYLESLREINRRTEEQEYEFFEQNKDNICLSRAKTLLSLGAGDGHFERHCSERGLLFSLRHYYAVEMDVGVCDALKETMEKHYPNVQTSYSLKSAEEFSGPSKKVDVILCMRMLSHVKNRSKFLRHAVDNWLVDGGQLIIIHSKEGNSFDKFGKMFNIASRRYFSKDVAIDLEKADLKTYQEFTIDDYVDLSDCTKALANIYFVKDTTEKEFQDFKRFIEDTYPDKVDHLPQSVFVVTKPSLNNKGHIVSDCQGDK